MSALRAEGEKRTKAVAEKMEAALQELTRRALGVPSQGGLAAGNKSIMQDVVWKARGRGGGRGGSSPSLWVFRPSQPAGLGEPLAPCASWLCQS